MTIRGFSCFIQQPWKQRHYSVVATNDPGNALQLVAGAAFDLVIVDYEMPHMNGAAAHALSAVDDYVVKGGRLELHLHRMNDQDSMPIDVHRF